MLDEYFKDAAEREQAKSEMSDWLWFVLVMVVLAAIAWGLWLTAEKRAKDAECKKLNLIAVETLDGKLVCLKPTAEAKQRLAQ